MKKLNNKKGFTLAELLIVVAIIAVLAAISIPIFNSQLEKAREATDVANIRAAYAEVMTAALTGESSSTDVSKDNSGTWSATVTLKQATSGWQSSVDEIGGITVSDKTPKANGTCTIACTSAGVASITFSE